MENKVLVNANSKEIISGALFQETCEAERKQNERILGVTARSSVAGYEALNGEFRVTIKTVFRIVKHSEEGYDVEEKETESVKSISDKRITPMSKAYLFACVTDVNTSSGNPMGIKASVEINGWFIRERKIELFDKNAEGVYCKTTSLKVQSVSPLSDYDYTLSYTDEARMPIERIIDCYAETTVSGAYPSDGSYRIEGEANIKVLALTDNKQFLTQMYTHPFSVEIADELVTADSKIDARGTVKGFRCDVTESDKRVILFDLDVRFCGTLVTETEIEGVVDAYCKSKETSLSVNKEVFDVSFCIRSVREKAVSTVNLDNVQEILGSLTPLVSAGVTGSDGAITVEGVVSSTVIYLSEDNAIRAVETETPFLSVINGEFSCDNLLTPEVSVTNVTTRIRGGKDIETTTELLITVRGIKRTTAEVVSDVVIGADKEEDDYAISLYIVRPGESLFDVAKAMNSDEESIMKQNPELALPMQGGEKVIFYKELPYEIA